MSVTLRVLTKFGNNFNHGKRLIKQSPIFTAKSANLVTVENQSEKNGFYKTPPFPYKKRRYNLMYLNFPFLDPTVERINANSKVVIVDGNMGSKKEEVAKYIAKAFGLHYMPEPRIDDLYVNNDGFDYRTLNQYIHPKLHAIDEKMYYENPHHEGVPWFKMIYYKLRFKQYIDAMAHLFNTGQGVVLERSPFSDLVFTNAMYKCGFLPKDAYDFYYRLRYDTLPELKRPHLIIYLDTDVDVCLKRIKEKGIPYQINSKVLNKEYLFEIENTYKNSYLSDINLYSEVLVFKWNQPSSSLLDNIIHEIENAKLEVDEAHPPKFFDWFFYKDSMLNYSRYYYTRKRIDVMQTLVNTSIYDVDSLAIDANDCEHRDDVYENMVPHYGFNLNKSSLKAFFLPQPFYETEEIQIRCPFY